jgi:hypothetical protein
MKKNHVFLAVALAVTALGSFLALRNGTPDEGLREPSGPASPDALVVEGLVRSELEGGENLRLSASDGESGGELGGPQLEEPRGEPWVRLKYDKRVYGRRLGDVLFEFYGQDWDWLEPLFSRHDIDPDEPITINEELGDLESCLPRFPEFLLKNYDETPFGKSAHLRMLPKLSGTQAHSALDSIASQKTYNPQKRKLDKASPQYSYLREVIQKELQNLDELNRALEVRKRNAIVADLEGFDAYHRPKIGWIRVGPIVCIGDPAYSPDPRFTTVLSPMGANVAHPECWLFSCNYMMNWKLIPDIANEIQAIIDYQEALEPVLISLVAAVPTKL